MARRWLLLLLIAQGLTHLFWLSPAVHSGQVAIPWMMNRGMRLFGEIWEQHAPGSSLLGAAAQTLLPMMDPALLVKLLNTALVLALTLLIYQLAKALSGKESAGLLAALTWAWWAPVYGNIMLYFDTLLAACVLLALLITYRGASAPSRRQLIAIGLLMGAATLFKQHAWLALGIVGIWLALWESRRAWLIYAISALIPPLLLWLILAGQGLFDSYLYWNWTFNLAGTMDGVPLDGDFFRKLLLSNMLVIPFALLAWRTERRQLLLVLMWLAGSDRAMAALRRNPRHGPPALHRRDVGPGVGARAAAARQFPRMGYPAHRTGRPGAGHRHRLALDRRRQLHPDAARPGRRAGLRRIRRLGRRPERGKSGGRYPLHPAPNR